MGYKLNVLGQITDQWGKIIINECPPSLIKLFEDYEDDISDLKSEIKTLENEVDMLKDEVSNLEDKVSVLESDVTDLENDLDESQEQKELELEKFGKLIHKNTRHLAIEYYYDTDNEVDLDFRIMNMKYEDVLPK